MGELSKLPNIGKTLEGQLQEVGIKTAAHLKECGSRQAWLKIKEIDPSACYNRLGALEGALQGIRWRCLSDDIKQDLKSFYQSVK